MAIFPCASQHNLLLICFTHSNFYFLMPYPSLASLSFLLPTDNHTFVFYVPCCAKSLQSCLTPCDAMDCSLPDSSVHEIL